MTYTYLVTMAMLMTNAMDDELTQQKINRDRVKHADNPFAQLQLDRKQQALHDARERNHERIVEIAVMN